MYILSAEQVRQWDQYTMDHEPVSSLQLMERAASRAAGWIMTRYPEPIPVRIYCGKGNNGGDGLVIARILLQHDYPVTVFIQEFGHLGTADFQANLARLHQLPAADIHFVQDVSHLPAPDPEALVVDALYGTGLNRPLEGLSAALVNHINATGNQVVSIDLPSGMMADHSSFANTVVCATHTLSFQCYKKAFLFAENAPFTGELHILDIGLSEDYSKSLKGADRLITGEWVRSFLPPRPRFAHKGQFGHVCLSAGSVGKIGAALLAARAVLRSGAGLLTCHLPASGVLALHTALPEAMCRPDPLSTHCSEFPAPADAFTVWAAGPGWGQHPDTAVLLRKILQSAPSRLVLDADALNILAQEPDLLALVPPGTLLTPHPGEFKRLFGDAASDFERADKALDMARKGRFIVILKGHHTLVCCPDGNRFFNSTGNPGMARGGSGDVLTGLLAGLLAQGLAPEQAALLGVYLHGLAGDLAAHALTEYAMQAGDIIAHLPDAFRQLAGRA